MPDMGTSRRPSSLLKKPQLARYGVKNGLVRESDQILMYCRVHSGFSPIFALSRTRLRIFQQAASPVHIVN
jgi:hypothetical protein